jgi:hypothetical protein
MTYLFLYSKSRGSSGGIVSDYGLDDRIGRSRFDPRQGQIFLLALASRPALGPTQPPIQWVPGVLSPGVKSGRGVTLTTHPHLVPRLRMSRSYTFSPPCASMACSGTAFTSCKRSCCNKDTPLHLVSRSKTSLQAEL